MPSPTSRLSFALALITLAPSPQPTSFVTMAIAVMAIIGRKFCQRAGMSMNIPSEIKNTGVKNASNG